MTSSWQENCLKPLWQKSLLTVYIFIVISLTPYLLKIKFLSLRNLSKVNQLPKKFDYLKHTRYVQNNSIIFYLKRQFATQLCIHCLWIYAVRSAVISVERIFDQPSSNYSLVSCINFCIKPFGIGRNPFRLPSTMG